MILKDKSEKNAFVKLPTNFTWRWCGPETLSLALHGVLNYITGLSEVLCGLGKDRLEKLMPEVVSTTSRPEVAPHVKEGYLLLYIYLPASFGSEFLPFVDRVIPSILKVCGNTLKRTHAGYLDFATEVFDLERTRLLYQFKTFLFVGNPELGKNTPRVVQINVIIFER